MYFYLSYYDKSISDVETYAKKLKDIAREAGVSAMTVSRVINKRYDQVSSETVQRMTVSRSVAHKKHLYFFDIQSPFLSLLALLWHIDSGFATALLYFRIH